MSNAGFAELDAIIHSALVDIGFADVGSYQPRSGPRVDDAKCVVDRSTAIRTEYGIDLRKCTAVVSLLSAGISQRPVPDDVIEIDGEVFTVIAVLETTESEWVLSCRT